jgi:hypothetical protein
MWPGIELGTCHLLGGHDNHSVILGRMYNLGEFPGKKFAISLPFVVRIGPPEAWSPMEGQPKYVLKPKYTTSFRLISLSIYFFKCFPKYKN